MMNKRYLSVVLALLGAISGFPAMAEDAGSRARNSVLAENVCVGESRTSYAQHAMEAKILAYQVLTEEALSLRASAIAFLDEFKEKEARGLPLSGADLRLPTSAGLTTRFPPMPRRQGPKRLVSRCRCRRP